MCDEIYKKLYSKLDSYQDTLDENKELFNTLLVLVNNKAHINKEMITRIDDVLEDVVSTNVSLKIIIEAMKNDVGLSISNRETDRTIRNEYIKSLIPLMILFYNA